MAIVLFFAVVAVANAVLVVLAISTDDPIVASYTDHVDR